MTIDSFKQAQVVVVSSVDWDSAWQRMQIFALELAEAGHDVFFVENTGFRNPRPADFSRVSGRLRKLARPKAKRPRALPANLRLIAPPVLPPTFKAFRAANTEVLVPALVRRLRAQGLKPGSLALCYFATATTLALLDAIEPRAIVHDCASNFRGHEKAPKDFARLEAELLRRSSLVLVDSDFLYEQKKAEHPNVVQLHQGVPESFLDARPPTGRWDTFVCYGTWRDDTDARYLTALADAGFDVSFIGIIKPGFTPPAGIKILPPVSPDRFVSSLEKFDVLLLPYQVSDFTRGIVPAKMFECLAMGRPVIASPLPALTAMKEHFYVAGDPADWPRIARELPRTETPQRREARIALARRHTYGARRRELWKLLEQAWDRPRAAPKTAVVPTFLSGLGWIGVLFGATKAATLLTQVAAGRWLGPEEYGRANLVLAAAAYLQIAPMLGFPTAIGKFLAAENDEASRARFTSTALAVFALWMLACVPALALARGPLERALDLPAELFWPALLLAAANSAYVVAASPLLGLKRFAQRGFTEIVYGAAVPLALLAAGLALGRVYLTLVAALSAAFLVGTLHALWSQRRYLTAVFEKKVLGDISRYAAVATLNLLAAACMLAPARLALNAHSGAQSVGVFSAYFTATVQMALAFLYMLQSVVIPMASDARGQREVWALFRRRAPAALAGAWAVFAVALLAALAVFGRRYPLRWDWALAFPLAAVLALAHGMLSALYAARDFSGLRVSVAGGLIAGLGNAALSAWLVPGWGVSGAAAALVASYALGLAFFAAARVADARRAAPAPEGA